MQPNLTFADFKVSPEGAVKDVARAPDGAVTVTLGCGATSTGFPVTEDDLHIMIESIQKDAYSSRAGVE